MKKQYVAPELTVHGNAAEITQILGPTNRQDFVYTSPTPDQNAQVSDGNDQGYRDIFNFRG